MPQIQYPFIDIAVHPAIRAKFAAGEAIALFSRDMAQVLWANGEGAKLFGYSDIYDLLDNGPDRAGVAFRQLAATARQLEKIGDRRGLTMRITAGFSSQAVPAEVSIVEIRRGETVVIFSAPVAANATFKAQIASMLKGFDDPDTHMAVIDDQGAILAASAGFEALGILPETCRTLIAAVAKSGEGLIKRPIASAAGYLPAAIGKLSLAPPLNLLFCVETVLGRMDPPQETADAQTASIPPTVKALPEAAPTSLDEDDSLPVEGLVETIDETHIAAEPAQLPEASVAAIAAETAEGAPAAITAPVDIAEAGPATDDTPHNLELAADQAETASIPASAPEQTLDTVPASPELASDEGEAQDISADPAAFEPEDHAEAEMAEAVLNESEATEDVQYLADMDGTDMQTVEAFAEEDKSVAFMPLAESQAEPETESTLDQQAAVATGALGPETVTEPVAEATADMAAAAADVTATVEPELDIEARAADVETKPVTVAEQHAAAEAGTLPEFVFRRDGRPVRFVWKLDAQGRFSEVSPEFARTVGPHAGNINGMSYRDLDSLFNLDPNHEIGTLLERRDTWSGRTIRWPVEGTDLVVPVDLAALPTYSRNREFDGFRGFGIIRVADAEQDPQAVGLTLGAQKPQAGADDTAPALEEAAKTTDQVTEEMPAEVAGAEEIPLTVDGMFEHLHADETQAPDATLPEPDAIAELPEEAGETEDEFRGEVPALKVESTPLSAFSEKIIKLEERRARSREGLTPSEQNAFREIARQLEPFGKRPNEALLDQQKDAAPADEEAQSSAPTDQPATAATEPGAAPAAQPADTTSATPEEAGDKQPGQVEQPTAAAVVAEPAGERESEETEESEAAGDAGLTPSAADQIPLAILIHAGERLIYANSEFKRFTGYGSLEALERAGGLDALIMREEGPNADVYTVRADGGRVAVSARLQSVRYEGAKLLMLTLTPAEAPVSAEETIAEEQQAARKLSALKVEADELRSILETATDGVVVLDMEGRIRSMNRSASALFNFEDSETRGKPFAMLFAHESQKSVQDYLNGLAGHGVASVLNDGREVIGREASGGFIPLFMTMGRMPGSNSYCAVIRDITQWKRSEEELKAAKRSAETANQHKSDFLARVSHEIRTPLNAIIGFADMIASEHFGPAGHPRYAEYANDIGRSGRHVLDIVNDLLDISKIEAGEMDLEFAAVGINDCVSEAVSIVQPQANGQRVIIRTSLSQSVPDVVADLRSIKQIAINILANAIRFTPSGGQIVVSTAYEPNGSVMLRIRDTGVGMSKTDLEQAMKPFGQVSTGARKRGDGTGLGLPLTKAMVEANRALFSIQSAPSEGTLVEITFPPQRVLAD